MKDEDLRTQAELDQMLAENLDAMDGWFEELVELSGGDGPITGDDMSALARLAAGTALMTELGGTRVYEALAPQGQVCPYVIYFRAGGGDDNNAQRRTV